MKTLGMTTNGLPLSGKTMLVTGAARRLGRAIALAAAENGADVAITYRESAREARAVVGELARHGVEALAVRCEVTDEKSVRERVKEVAHGMIDLGEKSAAAFMKKTAKQTPMLRSGTAADIAAAVMFFATAPQFITGQVLAVDGGLGL